ncbi:DNA topoisomerase I, mitochondrial [Dirofilaria immitis]|nr:DNA topoisomerase I, mitochondrial [Dirofilaria immitis]
MATIAPVVQTPNSNSYSNGESTCSETSIEVKKEDMSNDDDIPLSRKVRMTVDDDDDVPLAKKLKTVKYIRDDDDVPLSQKTKPQKGLFEEALTSTSSSRVKKPLSSSSTRSLEKKRKRETKNASERKKASTSSSSEKIHIKSEKTNGTTANKRKKREEEEEEIWKWWEEEKKPSGIKWFSLSHKGPIFAPPYVTLPESVHFKYDGKVMKLAPLTEEIASFYAKILEHEYTTKETFNKNFFMDWRKCANFANIFVLNFLKFITMVLDDDSAEREKITDLTKCDFREMHDHYVKLREERRSLSKEEKQKLKEIKQEEAKIYGVAYIDGHKQKIGNFRIEPPDLFRGRGGHPKMGRLKDEDSEIPKPPEGHRWKEVRHDNTVTWLCSWTDNILGSIKYIMLNPSSKIKGEKDYEKFETARRLKDVVGSIRENYTKDLKSKEMRVRQRALALRAGNEKDVDEAADTVGCCSLRCEHIKLHEKLDDSDYVVEFDFLGKDSIRYYNKVPVEKRTASLNKYLQSLMPGLTAKVFRTYNASITLQQQLDKLTKDDSTPPELLLCYNRANRQVAILCNHQRAVPKEELEKAHADAAKQRASKRVDRIKEQLRKLKIQRTDKDENKQIALSTSKLNYLDPRISVAWCKKYQVPIEKIFNKTQREKFRWAIDMADEDFVF